MKTTTITLTLSAAQRSALECAGLSFEPLSAGERALRDAWTMPNLLEVEAADLDLVIAGLNDRANAEDENADNGIAGSRRAEKALTALAQALSRRRPSGRSKGDDDGVEYADPRDERDGW